MKYLIVLPLLFLTTSADKRCHGIFIDDQYFNVEIIKEGINKLQSLVYNRNDNNVYFTFDQLSKTPARSLGYVNLETKKVGVVEGIRNATAIAIDQVTNKIFVGGCDGLYKINDRMLPERLPIQDDIKNMHFKNALYFTNGRKEAFKFEDGFATQLRELQGVDVDNLILDDDNNIFFIQKKKLFRVKLGTRAINTHEGLTVDAIGTNFNSKAYICADKGVFVYNKYKYVLDKIADLTDIKAITFNKNEPIYAVADLIIRLKLNEVPCFED